MSWKVIKELKENRAKLFNEAQELRNKANGESRDLTGEEETRHAKLLADVENYGQRIAREEAAAAMAEKIGDVRSMASDHSEKRNSLGMPAKDFRKYSLLRAIQLRANNQPLDGLELEASQEIARRYGKQPQGFYVPMEARALDTTAGAAGIQTTVLEDDFIQLLRNKLVIADLGATIMSDLTGKFAIPRQTNGATAYWLGEGACLTGSNLTLDQVPFQPRTVGAFTDISRQFIAQTSLDAEALVRNDLAKALANAIDAAAIAGTGSSNQPTGILYTSGVSVVSHGTNGGAETLAKVVEYETDVLGANVNPDDLAYLTNSRVFGVLKTTDKTAGGFGQYLIGMDGKLNNYDVAVTNAIPRIGTKGTGTALSTMIFGNWPDLVVGFWGGLDVLVDPYSQSTCGVIRIVVMQDCDVGVRHPQSFAVATDIVA